MANVICVNEKCCVTDFKYYACIIKKKQIQFPNYDFMLNYNNELWKCATVFAARLALQKHCFYSDDSRVLLVSYQALG